MAYRRGLAFYYDDVMADAPYDQWVEFTQHMIKKYEKDVQTIADLGCGTGEITLRLAALGYNMIGVDYSSDMLTIADQKSVHLKESVLWTNQDIRLLGELPQQDLMISYCDVMNYITTTDELLTTFKNVYNNLNKNGLFIFDVHSLTYVKNKLINESFADVRDHFSYIWFCHEGESTGEMIHEITCFAKNVDKTFNRFVEIHEQRTFSATVYRDLLKQANFKHINIYDDFSIEQNPSSQDGDRIFFVAIK